MRFNNIHVKQCLYLLSLYCREDLISLLYPKESLSVISKQLGRKDFSVEQLQIDSFLLLCKQKNSISINQ